MRARFSLHRFVALTVTATSLAAAEAPVWLGVNLRSYPGLLRGNEVKPRRRIRR